MSGERSNQISQETRSAIVGAGVEESHVATIMNQLHKYAAANWDGDGADGVPEKVLAKVRDLFVSLPETYLPDVTAGYNGSVGLSWRPEGLSLFILVSAEGSVGVRYRAQRYNLDFSASFEDHAPVSDIIWDLRPTLGFIEGPGWRSLITTEMTSVTTITVKTTTLEKLVDE